MSSCRSITIGSIIKGFYKEHTVICILYISFLLALPLKDALLPHLIGKMYGNIRKQKPLTLIFGLIIVTIVIIQVIRCISDFVDNYMHPAIQSYTLKILLQHKFNNSNDENGDIDSGALMANFNKTPAMVFTIMEILKESVTPGFVTLLIAIAYIGYQNWMLGLALAGVVAVMCIVIYTSTKRCFSYFYTRDRNHSEIYSNVVDMISNIGTIVSMETGDDEIQYLRPIQKKYEDNTMEGLKCSFIMKYIVLPLTLSYIIFASWYSYKFLNETQIIAILIVNFIVLSNVLAILESNKVLFFKWGILKNSLDALKVCESGVAGDGVAGYEYGALGMNDAVAVEFRDVSYSYPNGKVVFDHLSLSIPAKKITLIQGHIGIGKTTFIALITKKLKPRSGTIVLPRDHHRIFVVPQTPRLFARTLYENIVYGMHQPPSKQEVIELIHQLDLYEGFLVTLPDGLETKVGVMGSRLSGGQRQIVHIVRLFLNDPDIIILDEPTSALDVETKKAIMNLLVNAIKDRTVIMVTHDESLKEYADNVIQL